MNIKRTLQIIPVALLMALPLACKDKETKNPDEAGDEKGGDPMAQLKEIPVAIQAEVDLVLKPITDAEALMASIETAPDRLKISAKDVGAALKAAFDADVSADAGGVSASASVDLSKLDLTAEAKAELEGMIAKVQEIKAGIAATPDNVAKATANIVAHGGKAVTLGASVTTSVTAKLKFAQGEQKAALQQQLADADKLVADSKQLVTDAQTQVKEIPAKMAEMGVKLTASFAGSATTK